MLKFESNNISRSILVIIVNHGKGSKVLDFVHRISENNGSCYYGKGTMQNKLLRTMEIDEVGKEIIFIPILSERETEILNSINKKFLLERKNHGIAFVIPISKKEDLLDYAAIFAIVDEDKVERVVDLSQEAGYFGGTVIELNQNDDKLNKVLDTTFEPNKKVVLMVLSSNNAKNLSILLKEELNLNEDKGEKLVKIGVSKTVGLYEDSIFGGLE